MLHLFHFNKRFLAKELKQIYKIIIINIFNQIFYQMIKQFFFYLIPNK